MSKSICALVHRPDSTRAAFHAYYEENHAPLGARHFPFTRYVRNHFIDGEDLGYDTISEFWAEDIEAAAALMNGPVGDILRADERRFMDQSRIASGGVEEHELSTGVPAGPDGIRTAFLINPALSADAISSAAWRQGVMAWGRSLAADRSGVSLDIVQSWTSPAFPAAAVLWIPGEVPLPAVPASLSVRRVVTQRMETPAEHLLGNR